MFGKLNLFVIGFLLSACADPQYIQASHNGGELQSKVQVLDCNAKFKPSATCLYWRWESFPTSDKPGTLSFRLFDLDPDDGFPITKRPDTTPYVLLWMPSMGHGSSPVTVTEVREGVYQASNIFFVMPGDWEIRFQIREGTKVIDEAVVSLNY